MSVTPLGLRAVSKWMEDRNVERCIVSPLNHKGSRPKTEEERATMLANFLPYKGRIDRMTIIDAGEVETADQAVAILKREMADGAIGFGEHYGVGLMFDDPKNLMLYEACEKVGLPVMFHIDQNKNMVEPGMARVDRVLKMFPKCNLVAHAYWWRQLKDADRQLQEHPNLYADMSGQVVVSVLERDRKFAREFLIRNQDKILWATDEGWWSFANPDRQMKKHYTFFEELNLPDQVRRKIYRENAEKVFGLKNGGEAGPMKSNTILVAISIRLYTDEEAEAFRAKLDTLKYPTTPQAACEALGIDLKRLTGKSGSMNGMASGVVSTSWVELSKNYSISFHARSSLQGADGKLVENSKGLLHQVSIYTRVEVREVQKKEDKVEVSMNGDSLFVDVTSPSGIGGAKLALTSGAWPKKLVVRLKYAADKPFTNLEGPAASLIETDTKSDEPGQRLECRRLNPKNGFEADIPEAKLKVLRVGWIDAYRN